MATFQDWRKLRLWKPRSSNSSDFDVEHKLLDQDDEEPSSRRASEVLNDERPLSRRAKSRSNRTWLLFTTVNMLLVCISGILNKKVFWDFTRSCIRDTSAYCTVSPQSSHSYTGWKLTCQAPIIESSQPLPYHEVRINGTLWPPEDMSWSRREPGDPIGEAMWDSFEDMHTFPITRKQILALGKDPDTAARYDEDYWGMGNNAYIAALDSQHKMHCLNELRKMAFADYADGIFPVKKRPMDWIHLRHCTDMLAQDSLCHADADLITYQWRDTQPLPFPDFSINRKCRNIDDLIAFRNEHRVDMHKYEAMRRPKNIQPLPIEAGYYSTFGFAGSVLYPGGEGYPNKHEEH